MTRPLRELIEAEIERSNADLAAFRARSITIVTTSSGVVTLLTAAFSFAASRTEDDKGLPDLAIVLIIIAMVGFIAGAGLALCANWGRSVDRPDGAHLKTLTTPAKWKESDADLAEEERKVANVEVQHLLTLRAVADDAAGLLNWAILCQLVGIAFAAAAGLLAAVSLN